MSLPYIIKYALCIAPYQDALLDTRLVFTQTNVSKYSRVSKVRYSFSLTVSEETNVHTLNDINYSQLSRNRSSSLWRLLPPDNWSPPGRKGVLGTACFGCRTIVGRVVDSSPTQYDRNQRVGFWPEVKYQIGL